MGSEEASNDDIPQGVETSYDTPAPAPTPGPDSVEKGEEDKLQQTVVFTGVTGRDEVVAPSTDSDSLTGLPSIADIGTNNVTPQILVVPVTVILAPTPAPGPSPQLAPAPGPLRGLASLLAEGEAAEETPEETPAAETSEEVCDLATLPWTTLSLCSYFALSTRLADLQTVNARLWY